MQLTAFFLHKYIKKKYFLCVIINNFCVVRDMKLILISYMVCNIFSSKRSPFYIIQQYKTDPNSLNSHPKENYKHEENDSNVF